MSASDSDRAKAQSPDDLFRFFAERASAGDIEGLVDLYEDEAAVAFQPGDDTRGAVGIRAAFEGMLAGNPQFSAEGQRRSVVVGDIALTSARFGPDMVTAEIARRQADGTWKWVIDIPNFLAD
jgi:ketosteroid isomerase-like protein